MLVEFVNPVQNWTEQFVNRALDRADCQALDFSVCWSRWHGFIVRATRLTNKYLMLKGFKLALFLTANRGRLHWFPKNVSLREKYPTCYYLSGLLMNLYRRWLFAWNNHFSSSLSALLCVMFNAAWVHIQDPFPVFVFSMRHWKQLKTESLTQLL